MSYNRSLNLAFLLIGVLFAISFTLVILFPSKPPKIVEINVPTSAVDPQIRITFSKQMDKDSLLNGGIVFTPALLGNTSWSGNTMFYTPKNNLEFGREYKIQIKTTVKALSGEYLKDVVEKKFVTNDLSLLYISDNEENYGRLMSYKLNKAVASAISPEGYEIKKYDYDPISGNILVLANSDKDKIAKIYLLDLETREFSEIEDANSNDYQIHYVKWLPFENAILVSRTKILFKNKDGEVETLSQEPVDSELVLYDFDTEKNTVIKTGNALIYEFFPSPDGLKISFINDDGAFAFKDVVSGNESLIATTFINYFGFSPHGKYAIYLLASEFSTFTLKTDIVLQDSVGEKKIITIDETDCDIDLPAISFDEKTLAFKYKPTYEDYRLALVDLENNNLRLITEKNSDVNYPVFGPDNLHLAFTQNELGLSKIVFYLLKENSFVKTDISGHDLEWFY